MYIYTHTHIERGKLEHTIFTDNCNRPEVSGPSYEVTMPVCPPVRS